MTSRSTDQAMSKLEERRKRLHDVRFPTNYLATQHALDDLRDDTSKVKDIREHMEEVKQTKGHTRDFENAESELMLVEDLYHQKKRCLESVLYVSEIENMFQNVQSDIEERAMYLTERRPVFDSVYRGEDIRSQTRMHKDCVYAVRESWAWLKQISSCMEKHIENASTFHQFHHDVRHLEEDMVSFLNWMDSPTVRAPVKTKDPSVLLDHFRLLINSLLDYQNRVDRLATRSRDVHPIPFRKELPDWPVKARLLVTYSHKHVSLEKEEAVKVLHIEDPEKWKIRTQKGVETEVPGIILVIPPPDPACFQEIKKLREQMYVHHRTTSKKLRSHLIQFLSSMVAQTQAKDMQGLSTKQKSDLMKLPNDVSRVLHTSTTDDTELTKLKSDLTSFRKVISQIKPGQKDVNTPTVQKWNTTAGIIRLFEELQIYANNFEVENEVKTEEEKLLIQELTCPPLYCSNAYFERVTPMIDIDTLSKEARMTSFKSDIYIHERHNDVASSAMIQKQEVMTVSSARPNMDMPDGRRPVDSPYEQTSNDTQKFVISGVVDPKTNQKLSLSQAVAKGIINPEFGCYNNLETGKSFPIAQAIAMGLIDVEYADALTNGHLEDGELLQNSMETKTFAITGVVDPRTGETISVKEAIAAGLIDPRTGKFCNPVTKEEMPLMDAIRMGYLMADLSAMDEDDADGPMYQSYTSIVLEDTKFQVSGVVDPTTGNLISLKRAIQDGIVDPVLGIYKNPATGETMSLEEALLEGLIKGHEFDPQRDREGQDTLTFQQLKIKKQTFKAGEKALVNGDAAVLDPGEVLLDKLRDKLDTSQVMVRDPKTGKPMSLEDAIANGVIDLANGTFTTANGEVIPLQEAAAAGYIDPSALHAILSAYEDRGIGQLIRSGQFDPETGLVTDPSTGKTMTLQAAIENGVIDPDSVFFYDVHDEKINSLARAIEAGRLDPTSGKIKASGSSQPMSFERAINSGQIIPDINPREMAESVESLSMLKECMDTSMKGVKIPQMSELASVEEAVTLRALIVPKASYADENTVGVVPLQLAMQMEKVEPNVAVALFSAFDKHSLQQEMDRGALDPISGKFVDPNTRAAMPVDEAKKKALWNPNYVYCVDEETGNVTSLGAMVDQGKFNPASGKYVSDTTGQSLSIAEAISQGLITPTIDVAKFVDLSAPLKDLIDSGKVNPRTTEFVAGDGLRMSLRDGLANGFLTMGSKVKLDPETGDVFLVSNEGVVQSLIEVKENSDWLSDIERALASQGRPSEKLGRLKQQAEDCQGLKQELAHKTDEIKSAISEAERLVQNNTAKDQDRDESAQQFQKLRSSMADLKVRLDTVDSEVENRRGKLTMMSRNLEELYYHLEEFDQWLDMAIEKSQDLQAQNQDLEAQHTAFKEFMEEVKDKEEDMTTLVKSSDEFKDTAQDVEKEIDAFRKRLENLPTIQEETERGVLDEELESIEAKFKDISKDCGKHMERLSSLVKYKKAFDDYHEKLSLTYPDLQTRLNELTGEEEFGMDPSQNAQEREHLKAIKADLIGQERKLKDLTSAGERLADGYSESGMHEESEEIKAMVELKQVEHRSLAEEIGDNEQLLDTVLAEQQNVLGRLGGIEAGLEDAEKFMKTESDISLNNEVLSHQLEEQRLLTAEISSSHALLERLSEDTNGVNDAEEKVGELLTKAETLENLATARSQLMEEVQSSLHEIDAKAGVLDSWLSDSIRVLKPKGGASKPTRAKVDNLHENKKEKEEDMRTVRKMCGALLEKDQMKDEYALKETLGEVETKWNDLTELLVQQVSLEALSEIDGMLKYLDKAENEINTAEPISIDPETLSVQLRDHKSFNDDLKNKRNAVKDIIDKCTQMLRETANSQTDEIKARLDSINTQADVVCQLSAERLQQLEAALPLATHYGENQTEVGAWLDEMEAELNAQGEPGDNLEQVKKQHDHLKTTQQIIEDHKLFIDDLNSTGLELMDVCSEGDAVDIQNKLLDTNKRYEGLKSQARGKARDLTDAKRKHTQETSDALDHLLDDLNGLRMTVSNADTIPASPDKLKNEIDENKAVLEDLDRQKGAINKADEIGKNPKTHGVEDPGDVEDVKQKVGVINEMAQQVMADSVARDKALNSALKHSEKFYDLSTDVMSGLRDLKDSLCNHEPPGVDPDTVKEQQAELAGLKKELEKARELVGECKVIGADLCNFCGEPGAVEVQKQLEDLTQLTDDVNDTIRDRGDELRKAFQHADQFKKLLEIRAGVEKLKSINTWLPVAEHRLASMHAPATNPDVLQDQMEEMRMFKAEVHPHIVEMQQLNQEMTALRNSSPIAAEALQRPVKQANEKWAELLKGMTERETKLTDTQLKVGEVSQAMEDVIVALDNLQPDLEALNEAGGDPKSLETHMRKLQLMQADIRGKEKAARKLNKAVEEILQSGPADKGHSALRDKREEMNSKIRSTQATAKEKENRLQEAMRQIKKFLGVLDDQLAQIVEFRNELKTNQPFGALPDTSEKQYAEFVKKCQKLDNMEKAVEGMLASGQEIIKKNEPKDVVEVSDRVKRLRDRWMDTREKARKRKEKMEEHLRNVNQFHSTLKAFTDWLNGAEMGMRSFKYPSKLVDLVTKQIQEHGVMRKDLESQASKMNALDSTGTYLKYFGRKQDTVYIKNLLVGIRLRWKKLLRRTDERGRLLQQAYKEDKRFDDMWRGLCDWLDESMQMLSKFMNPTNQPAGMKQDIDELKKIDLIRRFNLQLTAKHPTFYSATRLGRNLKDRCTKTDSEREVLHGMLEQLKSKWNAIRSVVSKSQNKLDEALLTSGRVSDALQSLLEWLQKAEATLDSDSSVYGDLDTVHMLIEQHRNIQQELAAREATVLTMKAPGNLPPVQSEDLSMLWDRVLHLSDMREVKLKEGLKLAEEFQEVVTVMREFLPQAEAQLKFRALPEDEMVILQLIEKHEKFQDDLRNHQDCVDKIKGLAEEILLYCHPNAIRFVKYYLTITQTRWDQLLQRAKVRGERLQEALRNIQGNAALLEELLAWLTDAQALLATKERDPIPDDLKVVETLLKEHLEFHEEVTSKNNDAERLSKLVTTESKMAAQGKGFGSNMKLNEFDGYNPRVIALQNKWRTVWRMSVDRKKQLQDAHDTLLELESFKNFDFDLWRQRYLNWIQAKKFRITDFFRRQDKNSDGFLDREEFVGGMLKSKFPSNRTELNAVFDIFDEKRRGVIEYKNFVDALKTDRRNRAKNNNRKSKSDMELIHEEIEKELSSCTCRNHFRAEWLDEGKYRFGEKQKTCLVRFLNHTVMVRVGGGWVTLEEFVDQNDPCKAKGRTNLELRDTLALQDNVSIHSGPASRRGSSGRTSPFPTGVRRRQNDTGYASSNSSGTDPPPSPSGQQLLSPISTGWANQGGRTRSASQRYSYHGDLSQAQIVPPAQTQTGGSNDSSLRRSRITSSMVNLASSGPVQAFSSSSNLSRNTDFGSTGNLNRTKRLSTSSSNISGRKTPTSQPSSSRLRSHIITPRATTPTVAFGSSVRSRPTTPTFSPHSSSTPQRPGSVTPTKGIGSGPTRQRRLPSTPTSSSQGFR